MLSINFVMKAERNYLIFKKFVLMPDQIDKILDSVQFKKFATDRVML